MVLAIAAIGLMLLLAAAAALRPDSRGHGTHEQLGLPPCTFLLLFGRPCPSCGMTTAWAWLVRGQVTDAFRVNAGGALLGMLAMVGAVGLMLSALGGRRLAWRPDGMRVTWAAVVVLLVTLVQWGWRLMSS